jgi:hypothetical protein
MVKPIPGKHYRHYKGGEYKVVGFAKHSETLEVMILYLSLKDEKTVWARPLKMFNEVTINKETGEQVKRFSLISK